MLFWFVTVLILLLERPEGSEEDQYAEYRFTARAGVTGVEDVEMREQEYCLVQACGMFVLLQTPFV